MSIILETNTLHTVLTIDSCPVSLNSSIYKAGMFCTLWYVTVSMDTPVELHMWSLWFAYEACAETPPVFSNQDWWWWRRISSLVTCCQGNKLESESRVCRWPGFLFTHPCRERKKNWSGCKGVDLLQDSKVVQTRRHPLKSESMDIIMNFRKGEKSIKVEGEVLQQAGAASWA